MSAAPGAFEEITGGTLQTKERLVRASGAQLRYSTYIDIIGKNQPEALCVGKPKVNDAGSLRRDPAMRWIVGGKAAQGSAASPSQMGRSGSLRTRTYQRLPIIQDNGLTAFMHGVRREASCSTWIRASARLTANRR